MKAKCRIISYSASKKNVDHRSIPGVVVGFFVGFLCGFCVFVFFVFLILYNVIRLRNQFFVDDFKIPTPYWLSLVVEIL